MNSEARIKEIREYIEILKAHQFLYTARDQMIHDLLADRDDQKERIATLEGALEFYARKPEAFTNTTTGGADLLWPPVAFADDGDCARKALARVTQEKPDGPNS